MAAPDLLRKTCALSDIRVLCGFSFIEYEQKENGELVVHKHFDKKLGFNNESQENVFKVTEINFSDHNALLLKHYKYNRYNMHIIYNFMQCYGILF